MFVQLKGIKIFQSGARFIVYFKIWFENWDSLFFMVVGSCPGNFFKLRVINIIFQDFYFNILIPYGKLGFLIFQVQEKLCGLKQQLSLIIIRVVDCFIRVS